MNLNVKNYLIYIIAFLVGMFAFAVLYGFSVLMIFLIVGIILIPLVVVLFFAGIYFLWRFTIKKTTNKELKYLTLFVSYIIFFIILFFLDTYMSWEQKGNFNMYVGWFKQILNIE